MAPVTKSEARDARKTAAPATSSGCPHRPAGVRERISAFRGMDFTGAVMSVSIQPGAIAFTCMLCGANSIAIDLVNWTIAPFAALYDGISPDPKNEYMLPMLMIFPALRLIMDLAASLESRKTEIG